MKPKDHAMLNAVKCSVSRFTHQLDDIQYIAYRLLKFKYLLPMNRKIRLLPMNAIKMPKSLHLVAKLMPKGS